LAPGGATLQQNGTTLTPTSATPIIWTWGKITALSSTGVISGGSGTNIGNMTSGGGLSAAFDGITTKTITTSAVNGNPGYVGKNYGGQTISQVVIYPSTDNGFSGIGVTVTISLRASASAPSDPTTSGTQLGTTAP